MFPVMWLLVSKPTQLLAVAKVCSSSVRARARRRRPCRGCRSSRRTVCTWPWATRGTRSSLGQQKVAAGALMITVFYGALLASAYLFSLVDPMAGLLMVPTCVEINQ